MSDLKTDQSYRNYTDKHCPFCGCREFEVSAPATQDWDDTVTDYLDYKCGSTQKLFEGEHDGWITLCPEYYND